MNITETSQVLAKIKLGDNREVDKAGLVLMEWHENIGDLDFEDAKAAVTMHRKESTEYLSFAHVRAGARRARDIRERAERRTRPALEPGKIILDRPTHEQEFEQALAAERARKASAPIDPADWS